MLYIGVTLLHWSEKEVWKMTPYKILKLFSIHREFNPDKFEQKETSVTDIDDIFGGIE